MKKTFRFSLFLSIFLCTTLSAQTQFGIEYNLSRDNNVQYTTVPTAEKSRTSSVFFIHGFSLFYQKNWTPRWSYRTGYRFKAQVITTIYGNYAKGSSVINDLHSIPFIIYYDINPIKKGRFGRIKIDLGAGPYFNIHRNYDGGSSSHSLSDANGRILYSSIGNLTIKSKKATITLEASSSVSMKLYKSIHGHISFSRHFGFSTLARDDYSITDFSGFTEVGYTLAKGNYSTLSVGFSYRL